MVQQVDKKAVGLRLKDSNAAFPFWAVENLFENMDEDDAYVGAPGNEHGIDVLHIDTEEPAGDDLKNKKKNITFVQAKYSEKYEHKIDAGVISRLGNAAYFLNNSGVTGNSIFNAKQKQFQDALATGDDFQIDFVLVVAGELTDPQKTEWDTLKQRDSIELNGKKYSTSFVLWEKVDIYNKIEHPNTPDITLEFDTRHLYTHGTRQIAFIIIRGSELNNKLKPELYKMLFDQNPRFYLGLQSGGERKINAKIKATAEDPNESKNFLEYNNGITNLCDKFSIDDTNSSVTITNLKIVNGCQTILTLGKSSVDSNVNVLFKLYQVDVTDIDLKQNISNFTNSQNPISYRDMNSDHKQQQLIQGAIELLDLGFFWERKKGEKVFYEKDEKWKDEHSPLTLKIIDNFKVAKLIYAYYHQEPYAAVMLKEVEIFDDKNPEFKKTFVDPDVKEFIFAWVFKHGMTRSLTWIKDTTNQTDLNTRYQNIEKLSSSDYFKHICLALLKHLLDKNSNVNNVKDAILKIWSSSARKNKKTLTQKQLFEPIIPIFVFLLSKLEVAMRVTFFDKMPDITGLTKDEIKGKIGTKDSYKNITGKKKDVPPNVLDTIEAMNDMSGQKQQRDLDVLFNNIINEANSLDP